MGPLRVTGGAVDFQFETETMYPPLKRRLKEGSEQPIAPGAPHRLVPSGTARPGLQFWGRKD